MAPTVSIIRTIPLGSVIVEAKLAIASWMKPATNVSYMYDVEILL